MTGRKKSVSRQKSGGRQKKGAKTKSDSRTSDKKPKETARQHVDAFGTVWDKPPQSTRKYTDSSGMVWDEPERDWPKTRLRQSGPINHAGNNLAQAKDLGLEHRAKEAGDGIGIHEKNTTLMLIAEDGTVSSDIRALAKQAAAVINDTLFKDSILGLYAYDVAPSYKNPRMTMDEKRHELKHRLKRLWEDRFGWGGAVDGGPYLLFSGRLLSDGRMSLKVTWNNAISELNQAGLENPISQEIDWMADAVERYCQLTFGDVELVEKKHDYDDLYVKVIVPQTTR